jgi:hypothetical protein
LAAAVAHIGIAVVDLAIGEPLDRPAPRVAVKRVGAGGEVRAGAEATPGAGDDDGADVVVLVGLVEGVDQLPLHGGVEGVELVRPVQCDGEDLFGDLVCDGLVGHGCFLTWFYCISAVIPGRAAREPGIHTPDRGYGFRARA